MADHLSIDIETRSSVDIGKSGAYKYAQSPDFCILLLAYKWNDEPVKIFDLAKEKKSPSVGKGLTGSGCSEARL